MHARLLNISAAAEEGYRRLVMAGPEGLASLGDDVIAAELIEHGLARRVPRGAAHHLVANSASPLMRTELLSRERLLAEQRAGAEALVELYERFHGGRDFVEVIRGREATADVFSRAQREAVSLVRAFDRGPFLTQPPTISDDQAAAAARGVRYRVIYESDLEPGTMSAIELALSMGEEAHVLAEVPMKLIICDDAFALIVLRQEDQTGGVLAVDGVVVYQSPLLDALADLFESMWRLSVPISSVSVAHQARERDDRVLTLLSAGYPDAAIARHLGVSERTVQRQIARLQQTFGAGTRFQLGMQVARLRND